MLAYIPAPWIRHGQCKNSKTYQFRQTQKADASRASLACPVPDTSKISEGWNGGILNSIHAHWHTHVAGPWLAWPTVDGRNPAPVDRWFRWFIPLFIGLSTIQNWWCRISQPSTVGFPWTRVKSAGTKCVFFNPTITRPGYVKIAIEHGHRNSEFSHEKWWFSIAKC